MAKLGKMTIPDTAEIPGEGMASWDNPLNGFHIFALHYTADQDKRGWEWRREAMKGYSERDFDQEFELSFESWAGLPVYSSFNEHTHVSKERLSYEPRIHMLRWWDIGVHACVWAQLCDGRLSIFASRQTIGAFGPKEMRYRAHEIEASGLGIFIGRIKELSEGMFSSALGWKDVVDPAAWNSTITHETPPIRIFHDHGLRPLPGATQNTSVRVSGVEDWLTTMTKEGPALQIDPTALVIIDGMKGGYNREKEGAGDKPNKSSPFSHTQDACQYGISKLPAKMGSKLRVVQEKLITKGLDPAQHDLRTGARFRRRESDERESWLSY